MPTLLLQVRHERVLAAPVTEDVAVTTHHFSAQASPEQDDFDAWEPAIDTFWSSTAGRRHENTIVSQYRWYELPASPGLLGPPIHITEKAIPGTDIGTALPPQVALSCTEKTADPRRWGRFYVPGTAVIALTQDGYLVDAACTEYVNAMLIMQQALFSAIPPLGPIVFSRALWAELDITEYQVDNLLDVIRSRRFEQTTFRAIQPAGAG